MTLNQFKKAVSIYIDREFVAKMDGLGKWVFGVGAGAYLAQLDGLFNNYKDMLCKMGMCQPDGNIDIEKAYALIKEEAIKQGKVTQNIPMIGDVIFSVDDVEIFYRICKEYV